MDSAGLFRGVEVPGTLTDDPLDGPYADYLFRFLRDRGRYEALCSVTRDPLGKATAVPVHCLADRGQRRPAWIQGLRRLGARPGHASRQ
jgi:hypothetical protein